MGWHISEVRNKEDTETLAIPFLSYDDELCPAEMKELREMFPEIMAPRPCDTRISVQPQQHQSPGSAGSSRTIPVSNGPPVALVMPCQVEDRDALMIEVWPAIYQSDMEMKLGWDYVKDCLAITFVYKRSVISDRPANMGGQRTFQEAFKEHLGCGWGEPGVGQRGYIFDRFHATYRYDVQSLLLDGEKLFCRDPSGGIEHNAKEITGYPNEKMFLVKLFVGEDHTRQTRIVFL